MSIDLESFKENLSNIVRPNRFLVFVNPPTGAITTSLDADIMKFYATSATIPDRAFNEIEIKYYGMSYKIPAGEIIQDLVITFMSDEEWEIRTFFEDWVNTINNRANNTKEYVESLFTGSSIEVHQLNFADKVIAAYKFFHIFPKNVDAIELTMDTNDSHSLSQITFAYSYWERLEINSNG